MRRQNRTGLYKEILLFVVSVALCIAVAATDMEPVSNSSVRGGTSGDVLQDPIAGKKILYYEQLEDIEQKIYDALLKAVENQEMSCSFEKIDYDLYVPYVKRAVNALAYDYPEYFWLNGGYEIKGTYGNAKDSDTMKITISSYGYWTDSTNQQIYVDELQKEALKIAEMANQKGDLFEKVKFVHNYLVQNVEYDYDSLEQIQQGGHTPDKEYVYSAYGCLINKKTVCEGYADAFQLIMKYMGIGCCVVTGSAGEPHAWNCVELDGETYFIDVTWDDADYRDETGNEKYPNDAEYDYFCITEQELTKTHTIDESLFAVPDCTSTKYNYYVYNNYLLDTHDRNAFGEILAKQDGQEILSAQFKTQEEYQKAVDDLVTGNNWSQVPYLSKIDKFEYSQDDIHFALTIFLK